MKTRLIRLNATDSTNSYIKTVAQPDDELLVVSTRWQTAGRGQGSNRWESEEGKNLLFSLLVRPMFITVQQRFLLSMVGALSLKEVLDSYTDGIRIKWPNDLYWFDRKISGTLIETSLSGGRIKELIFGTGLNLNQRLFCSDAPNPVSLCQILGHAASPEEVLDQIIAAFQHHYSVLKGGDFHTISERYHASLYRHPGFFPYEDAAGRFEAEIVRVREDGRLVLKDRQQRERIYDIKEVRMLL